MKKFLIKMPMKLQFFAEQGQGSNPPAGGDDGQGGKATGNHNPDGDPSPAGPADPKDEKKYSDKDLDDIIGKKFARWKDELETQQTESKKYEEMNDLEKAQFDRDKANKEAQTAKDQLEQLNMRNTTRGLMGEAKLPIDESIVAMVTTKDAETTKSNVGLLISFAEKVQKNVEKEFLTGSTQHRAGNSITGKDSLGEQLGKMHNENNNRKNPYFQN